MFMSFPFQRRSVRQYKPAEYPIFKRQEANFSSQGITHMAASSGWISLVMPGNIIYRFHLDNPRASDRKLIYDTLHVDLCHVAISLLVGYLKSIYWK